jgi:aerobic-type carbon monoxide dehydrogenase small subunit (CoxS/CutS family)
MHLTVNGTSHQLDVSGHETLLSVLRERLGLTGTKHSCGRGECGACTVLMGDGDGGNGDGGRHTVYSCLTLAAACDGASVTTIEGIHGGTPGKLHPLQQAFIAHDAVQCGFCTSGQILSATALLEHNPKPSADEIRVAMSGNLCRCGTYPKILTAIEEAAQRLADVR